MVIGRNRREFLDNTASLVPAYLPGIDEQNNKICNKKRFQGTDIRNAHLHPPPLRHEHGANTCASARSRGPGVRLHWARLLKRGERNTKK